MVVDNHLFVESFYKFFTFCHSRNVNVSNDKQ